MRKRKRDNVEKHAEYMAQFRHKCECGKNVYMSKKYPKVICYYCGKMNYLDKKQEFEEKLKNALKKNKYMI